MSREWIIIWRKEKYTSQSATAKAAGLPSARYSRIENGYCDIRPEEASSLAKAFNVSVEAVLTGVKSAEPVIALPKVDTPPASKPQPIAQAALTPRLNEPTKPVIVPQPKGDDLSDPKNFTLQPPVEQLRNFQTSDPVRRAQVQQSVSYAQRVLHTSKVRPAVWVAWRDFARDAQKCLSGQIVSVAPVASVPPQQATPQPTINGHAAAQASNPKAGEAKQKFPSRYNKNIYGHFFDVAKELLSEATHADLSKQAATAKAANPEIGFMKHFRRITGEKLAPADLEKIESAAATRVEATG